MSWVARVAANGLVPASIYFAHGLPFSPEQSKLMYFIFRCIEEFVARYTDAIIVINKNDAAACQRFKLTHSDGHWYYVPGVGVDIDAYANQPSEELLTKLEQELGLRAGKPMVLFLGRFIPAKRPGDVLELARKIGPEVDFVLAGEGPLWKQIKKAGAGIGPHVKVIEFTDRVPLLLARCSLLVLPSVFREGLPRVLLEAYSAGKPAAAYDVRGAHDVIEHGTTGYLVQPRNVEALYESVRKILEDDDLRLKMGQAGKKRMREKYSIEASLSAILPAIGEILQQKDIWDLPVEQLHEE
jgi:glycosyltransferase involved in cell wall biosynthesis